MRQNLIRQIGSTSLLLLVAFLFFSYKNLDYKTEKATVLEEKTVTQEIYHGEFIHTPEASVFSGSSYVYGVEMNEMAKELATRVKAVQQNETQIIPVAVQGILSKKPEGTEGWDEILTITQIISVSDTPIEADVKI